MQDDTAPLQPELREAEQTLKATLAEACATDPLKADTGEMIKLDEMLAIASDAAKHAVSLRRRLRARRPKSSAKEASPAQPAGPARPAHEASGDSHRTFRDAGGVQWSVWAVQPQSRGEEQLHLRGPFSKGWLTFVSATEKRRLSPVPEDWISADDASLAELCARAEAARPDTAVRTASRPRRDAQQSGDADQPAG